MAGMHRDKCGAAFVAGFFKTLSLLKPKGLKVYGTLCLARNSIGEGKFTFGYLHLF
jgi:leucyl aminopeptidase